VASGRLRRNKSIGSYLSSLEQTATNLNTRQNFLTTGLASGSISESALPEELAIANKTIQTDNFVEGYSGWRISGDGSAEFGSVIVRGDINAYSGTIGYWNISTPAVSRVIGPYNLLGTFIESSAAGSNDVDTTSGTYVGLYKSYSPEEIVVTSKIRASNISTLTAENHQYEVGDYVIVSLEDDITFNNGSVPVILTDTTNDTFTYSNTGSDVGESAATGVVQLYNPDVAGLYLRDYGKREFDYGYFSSAGVAYVSAEDINIIENPSFEYKDGSNVIASSSTSWVAGTGLTLTLDNFTSLTYATIGAQIPSYSAPNITLTTATPHGISPNEYVLISNVSPSGYNGFWRAQAGTTGTTLVVNIGSNPGTITNADGYVEGRRTYDYGSKFGARVTWTSSALSTYFEGKLDYAAGSDYSIFTNTRVLYFGATIFPYYTPPFFERTTSVARYNLAGTFSSATANATTITYTGTGLTFVADQWLSVTGFTGTNAARFNITSGKISTANATTVVVQQAGVVQATSSGTGTASVGLLEATTATTHSFVADDIAFFDFKSGIDNGGGEISPYFTPHTLPDGTSGYSFKVLASPAPTTTKFYVSADNVYASLAGTIIYESNTNLDNTTRTQGFYKTFHPAFDISQIQLKYSNANTTPLSSVVSVATKAQWDAGTNKYYLTTSDKFMAGYLDPALGIPNMTKSDLIIIDADLLEANYKIQDPTGYAAQSDINFQIPGWMYKHNGNGVVSATKITSSTAFGYVIDNLYLATNNKAYYGNNLDTNRWYDSTLTNTAQASVEGTKTWIDIDLTTQDAQLNYLSRVGFKSTNFSKLLYSNPSVSTIVQEPSKLLTYSESESLTLSSGEYQYLQNTTSYIKIMSYLQTQVGDSSTSFELVANAEDILVSSGVSSNRDYAMIGGYYNGTSKVVVTGDEFKYNPYGEAVAPTLYTMRVTSSNFELLVPLSSPSVDTGRIRLNDTADVTLVSTTHAFQIGPDSGQNLRMDVNEIQSVNAGAASTLNLNVEGGTITAGNSTSILTVQGYLRVESAGDVSLASTNHHLQLGLTSGVNLRLDNNEIQAVNNGAANTLVLQNSGGNISLGNTTSTIAVLGNLEVGGGYGSTGVTISSAGVINADGAITSDGTVTGGNLTTGGSITRTALNGGGVTGASITNTGAIVRTTSSERYKQDIQSANFVYEDILLLSPKTFRIKEEVQSDPQARIYAGLIAEEVDQIESLKVFVNYLNKENNTKIPDGIAYGEMVSALVSAIKHQDTLIKNLSARLSALEDN